MAKSRAGFVCQACGARHHRWVGQCPTCGEWNTVQEELPASPRQGARGPSGVQLDIRTLADIGPDRVGRLASGIGEWDRVLGGGIVPGSVVLLGGDPGVGKSTLVLQAAEAIAARGAIAGSAPGLRGQSGGPSVSVLYVSGEESLAQLALRARRLGLGDQTVAFSAETDVGVIAEALTRERPSLCVVDSIQSVYDPSLDSAPGGVTQLRDCTLRLHELAKNQNTAVILVGHVTKEGVIAGPKVLEHMVDVVLYLEGERLQAHRLLRGSKNRFGATSEVGVFEMRGDGMIEVPDPSAAFLADRMDECSGSAVTVTLEGTRPLLLEIQALVSRSVLPSPRRVAIGLDLNRLALLVAVLSKRAGAPLHALDVHVNVVGGVQVEETAADLATALAILSSHRDVPLDKRLVVVGEVGLGGELRSVGQMGRRLAEAARFGFSRAIVPQRVNEDALVVGAGMEVFRASTVREAARLAGVD